MNTDGKREGVRSAARRAGWRSAALGCVLILAFSLAPATAADGPGEGRRVVVIGQASSPQRAVDEAIVRHLSARGYAATLENQDIEPAGVSGAAMVILSSTVAAKDVRDGWRHLPVPLLTWENDVLDDLAMTGKRHDVDFGEAEKERYVWLVNAPHPLSANLPAGVLNVYGRQAGMSWGKPGLGATTIATLYGQPDKAAIFAYEKGATMDYESLAPARRVMFFLDNDTFTNLSPSGTRLFDAAVDWASGSVR